MTKENYIQQNTQLAVSSIINTLSLLNEGCTIPFISRYRKEKTENLDEVQITSIRDFSKKYEEIIDKQIQILKSINEQDKLTVELKNKIESCFQLSELEDIYLPFKQKKETRGDKAKKMGLEPLAKMIMSQRGGNPEIMAEKFVKGEVEDEKMALKGAADIIAEYINENTFVRNRVRNLFRRKSVLQSKLLKGKEEAGIKYKDFFSYQEPLFKVPSYRLLAVLRAEKEGILSVKAQPEKDLCIETIREIVVKSNEECSLFVSNVCMDAYSRLMAPSLENEILNEYKEKADIEAIKVFSNNLKQLLLASPLGEKRILAIDPGFRTGCKVVCIDETGFLLHNTTIFPHPPQNETLKAKSKLSALVQQYKIEAIAIGDGTAGRETEQLIKNTKFDRDIDVFVVREDGASIYSASAIARKEFPDYDVTVRGAVSIGRRLMDPLAELVKIDPKSIGVGQYQYDVNQTLLKSALDDVVLSAVNTVGVDINTASPFLLAYVSGLNTNIAQSIVEFREKNGLFKNRVQIKEIKRLGEKSYEQCAGFLRIRNGENPLDNTSIHPESYSFVEKIAQNYKVKIEELIGNESILSLVPKPNEIDAFTFEDIIKELKKPGRDPRKKAKVLEFDKNIREIKNLSIGMKIKGIVTNITSFGCFVNIGLKEQGLIHKSNLAEHYVEDPSSVVSLHEHLNVEVIEIDLNRKRISLKKIEI
ncbi:MAG: RNA-binding transcriptional accessory protein [Flavobacteriia bacterium]|nr:RNA-binding transcriptional accessory protein [Flavobacteriia bacterium]